LLAYEKTTTIFNPERTGRVPRLTFLPPRCERAIMSEDMHSPRRRDSVMEAGVTSSDVSIGSGDHRVLAVHGCFGSSRAWGSLPDFLNRSAYAYTFTDLRVQAFAAYRPARARSDFSDQLKPDISTPVKVIVGVNHPAMSAAMMEQTWLIFFPEAEMTILPDAGHYPMFESPVSLATSIEEFLGRE
jgi:hypothetical protein